MPSHTQNQQRRDRELSLKLLQSIKVTQVRMHAFIENMLSGFTHIYNVICMHLF